MREQKSSGQSVSPMKSTTSSAADAGASSMRTRRVRFNDGHLTTTVSSYSCNMSSSSSSSSSSCSSPVDPLMSHSQVCQLSIILSFAVKRFNPIQRCAFCVYFIVRAHYRVASVHPSIRLSVCLSLCLVLFPNTRKESRIGTKQYGSYIVRSIRGHAELFQVNRSEIKVTPHEVEPHHICSSSLRCPN